jgi:hypothetical protein
MANNEEYNESTAFRDAQTAQEVRFLMRGLHQLAIDPHAEVPANFHATVMAKARELPLPRKRLWEQLREQFAVWAPVFAVGLVLSLSVHVWQGIRALETRPPGTQQTAARPLAGRSATDPLSIYQFQAQLPHATTLGSLVAARSVPQSPRTVVGFTPQVTRSTFVRIGILYADTLAALQSGAVETAKDRLRLLIQAVTSIQAPPALVQYLQEMQIVLQRQPPADHTMAQLVALFEPLYAHVYATDPAAAAWVLFQAGAWMENLSLAAAVGDQGALQQAPVVQSLHDALRSLNVPDTVLTALEHLRVRVARQPMTPEDLRAIQTLADTITHELSE